MLEKSHSCWYCKIGLTLHSRQYSSYSTIHGSQPINNMIKASCTTELPFTSVSTTCPNQQQRTAPPHSYAFQNCQSLWSNVDPLYVSHILAHHYPNSSILQQWPTQPCLAGQAAWEQQWIQFIQWLYSYPSRNTCCQALGGWLPKYMEDYHCTWSVCPQTYHSLYHHYQQLWLNYAPTKITVHKEIYSTFPTNQKTILLHVQPVTPLWLQHGSKY